MRRYECCYRFDDQFVFAERPTAALAGTLLMCSLGLLVGLGFGATLCCAGICLFEWTLLIMALCVVCYGYVVNFMRVSSSADIPGYSSMVMTSFGSIGLFTAIGRFSIQTQLTALHHYGLFGIVGVSSFLFLQICICIFLHEDERKHFLGLCGPGGEALGLVSCNKSTSASADLDREALLRFVSWIITWQWWRDCSAVPDGKHSGSAVVPQGSSITIINRSLKQVKVCLYSSIDIFCWLPFGGVSGKYVGFVKAEESHTFFLVHEESPDQPSKSFTLKVFQPCIFDQELACYRGVCGGQCLTFVDVEGMIRRTRPHVVSATPLQTKNWSNLVESSEDEAGSSDLDSSGSISHARKGSVSHLLAGSSHSSLTRVSSVGNFLPEGSHELRPVRRVLASPNNRKACGACSNEIVLRNRSAQEIRALLFRLNDYCCLVPLVGKLTACGDVILPENERRIVPKDMAQQEFTLKLYSVGPGSRELTYFTVVRGHTYTFCNSLLL